MVRSSHQKLPSFSSEVKSLLLLLLNHFRAFHFWFLVMEFFFLLKSAIFIYRVDLVFVNHCLCCSWFSSFFHSKSFDEAPFSSRLRFDILDIYINGPKEKLNSTVISQHAT
ncbi:uncharacterized protein LOC133815862 [Humulus lupulus]|uniref:uncharacterized protein LOC133815862 n=1 Tax=Humulus lupulus TaxID=3486 RepID=UPI002B406A06|nr:uncharacterized protein LOC133815862 [Humulus lupulus]